jgi:1,2-phenylacetyl-CoA epoxidase PaaB subunit
MSAVDRPGAVSRSSEPWEVFARQESGIPIRHIGTVDASNLDDATVFAYTLYEEWKWADMFIVRRDDVEQVVRPA